MESRFRTPPDSAHPWVFWFWSNGNLTREGITADLEAMHRVGIRGVLIMEVDAGVPKGSVPFLSPQWREMYQHMLREAGRLGIEVDMNNDGGWCGSGGPWITPELSMQVLVSSETHAAGPHPVSLVLPKPEATRNYYQDIAVLAFPTPAADAVRMADARPHIRFGPGRKPLDAAKLTDGNAATFQELPLVKPGESHVIDIDFDQPFAARALTVALKTYHAAAQATLAVSGDQRNWRTIARFEAQWPTAAVNFDRVRSRYFRLTLALKGPTAAALPVADIVLDGAGRMEGIAQKAAYINLPFAAGGVGLPPGKDSLVPRDAVLDISRYMDAAGRLTWDAPQGQWTILRIGHTSSGKMNHPAPETSLGLECDKLSRKAVDVHFAGLMGKLLADARASGARSPGYVHIDSWETGSQNWTPGFRQQFQARRGYDLLPYLPVITGRAVESQEVSERFLWDLRRTIGDLLLDNYAGEFQRLSRQHGLKLSIEAYGNGPLDDLPYAAHADLPVTEFWLGVEPWWVTREMASAAHTYGRPVLAAEAFTSRSPAAKWQSHPFRLKPLGDRMFTEGINRFIFHRYAMQPWEHIRPGIMMGPYGINFERTTTWWEQSRPWLDYLSRCQYLLQQGRFVADIGYLASERIPNDYHEPLLTNLAVPPGYDYDVIAAGLLPRLIVRDGQAELPSGMRYRVLILPAGRDMRVAQLRRIKELVQAGATVLGAPPTRSPSLAERATGDAEIRRLAAELWGECDGLNVTEHRFGKGRVVWGKPLAALLTEDGVPPDFSSPAAEVGKQIRYIHRTVEGREVYFLASAEAQATTFLCSFRAAGKRPELWWPDTGRTERVAVYDEKDGQTRIPIRLEPFGSVFVVFDAAAAGHLTMLTHNGVEASGILATTPADLRGKQDGIRMEADAASGYRLEVSHSGKYAGRTADGKQYSAEVAPPPAPLPVTSPWKLEFPKGLGAPESVVLDRLISWTAHPDDGVRHFSGTATYRQSINLPRELLRPDTRVYLDLGRVEVIAGVRLNGRDLGTFWKPPFRVDITEAAHAGENALEVRVVNLWPNRLIGDARLPEDIERDGNKTKAWPQWLLDGKPSPTGRLTMMTWRVWFKDDPLLDSGLLGPVQLEFTRLVRLLP